MKAIYTMWGAGAMLEVFEDKLAITPKGLSGFFFRGLKGTKTIPFFAISAIQFKKSGLTKGYLQFTLPGEMKASVVCMQLFLMRIHSCLPVKTK